VHPPIGVQHPMSEDQPLSVTSSTPLGEISQAPPSLEVFLDKHQTKIIVLAVLIAIGAIAYVVIDGIEKSSQESAGVLLSKAEDISELQGVVKNYEGTAASESAKVMLAELQWKEGQQDDAIATLKDFVSGSATHPARPSAQASLGAKLLSQGKTEEAAEIFREIADDTNARHLAPYAWISLGDIALGKGDKDAATEAYETVEREFPDSPFSQEALERRLLVKAAPPVEVAATFTVPDVSLTGEEEDPATPDGTSGDLIDAINGGALDPSANPLVPTEKNEE
jgi:predicted negative regulator of RcsB-dependent stress response